MVPQLEPEDKIAQNLETKIRLSCLLDRCSPSKYVFSQKRLVCAKIIDTSTSSRKKLAKLWLCLPFGLKLVQSSHCTDPRPRDLDLHWINFYHHQWKMLPSPVRFIFWASPCFVLSSQIPTVWSQAHPRVHEKNLQCHSWRWPHWSPLQPFRLNGVAKVRIIWVVKWCQVVNFSNIRKVFRCSKAAFNMLLSESLGIHIDTTMRTSSYGSPVYLFLSGFHVDKRVQDMDAKQAKCIQPQKA